MRTIVAIVFLSLALPAQAASRCEIDGQALHWAYDACMARYETDDEMHPGVVACANQAQRTIHRRGECVSKRIFKDRICTMLRSGGNISATQQACMNDRKIMGSTVKHGGI